MASIKQIKEKEYILENERELNPKEQSVFTVRDLNPMQAAEIYDILFDTGKFSLSIRAFIKAAELGIINWKNVTDENGKDVKFTKHGIKLLPSPLLTEIGLEVMKNTFPEFQTALGVTTEEEESPLV